MEESRGIASSPATVMAEEPEAITHEAVRDPSDQEWFSSIFGVDGQQHDSEAKHPIPKAPIKFREYLKDKKYFDPRVVSLGPYHHGEGHLKPMEKHKITAAKQFVDEFICENGGIYKKFKELTGDLKKCYDAEVVANISDDVFARMMFLDGCFVLHFIIVGGKTMLEISNDLIPLIILNMFLIENQLPFEFLDALMNLLWDSSSLRKVKISKFIVLKVLKPMGFYSLNSHRLRKWCAVVDGVEQYDSPLHLLDILRTILLDFPPSKGSKKHGYKPGCFGSDTELKDTRIILPDSPTSNGAEKKSERPHNFGSVMELKEIGIRFKKRRMESLMDISYKENLLFPRLLLPTMYINDTTISQLTISQLLNLTALEACSDTYSGCGVTSFIHFMDSLINDGADVKKLRSKGILHHSLGSDDEVARLFNTWPADVTNDLKLYSDIRKRIRRHRDRRVKISIATWWDKYFRSPWTAISFVAAVVLLVFTAIQTYFTAFPRG